MYDFGSVEREREFSIELAEILNKRVGISKDKVEIDEEHMPGSLSVEDMIILGPIIEFKRTKEKEKKK